MNTRRRKSSHRRHFRRKSYRGGILDTECAICLEHMSNNDVCTTKCNHKYHLTCILDWITIQKKKTCPTCRTIIPTSNRPSANANANENENENENENALAELRQYREDRNRNRDRDEARDREIDRIVLGHNPNDSIARNAAQALNNSRQSRRQYNSILYPDDI